MLQSINPRGIMDGVLGGLETGCEMFNRFAFIFFWYLKYVFVVILLSIGILTLMKLRGIYRIERTKLAKKEEEGEFPLKKIRLTVGGFYIFMAIGILFRYFTYFLMIILEPLPDGLLFEYISVSGIIDPKDMNRIQDLNAAEYPHEKTIYYVIGMISFIALLDVVLSIYLIVNNKVVDKKIFKMLFVGIALGIMAG